jgi:hypothetical protein
MTVAVKAFELMAAAPHGEFKLVFKIYSIHDGMRTGSDSMPRTKLE